MKNKINYLLIGLLIGMVLWFVLSTYIWSFLVSQLPSGESFTFFWLLTIINSIIVWSFAPIWIGAIAGFIIGKRKDKPQGVQSK